MMNRYLQDRMSRRMRDGRNPYGSRGGYVMSSRRDRASMSSYGSAGGRGDSGYNQDYDMHYGMPKPNFEFYGNYAPYEQPYHQHDFGYDMRSRGGYDYKRYDNDYRDYASKNMEKEYEEDLHEWIEKLKKHDKYGMSKEQVMSHAKSLGAKMKEYDEKELYATYLMMISDYKDVSNDPTLFIKLAIDWLEDDDVELKGSEKLCAYFYTIVKGEEE